MRDERADQLVEITPPSPARAARMIRALRAYVDRLAVHRAHARGPHPRAHVTSPGPVFDISGMRATFEELERITFDPAVIARVEHESTVALVRPDHRSLDVSAVAASLGWSRRARPARLYDVVPFGFELDMLELRLTELHGVVDRFVVGEAARGFGGMRKPLYLQRNWQRFAPFHQRIDHVIVEADDFDALYPNRQRSRTDWSGEDALRSRLWQRVRDVAREPDVVMIWADVDELLPRWFIDLLKHYVCPLPLRVQAPACRYHFGWRDPEATASITVFDAASISGIDRQPAAIRSLPARTFAARGATHLTSFLDPVVLQMKFAVTTDWEPAVQRYIRNAHDETAAMMHNGDWFGRPLLPYDAETDPLALVPATARLNRERYRTFWPDAALGGNGAPP